MLDCHHTICLFFKDGNKSVEHEKYDAEKNEFNIEQTMDRLFRMDNAMPDIIIMDTRDGIPAC
jgi:hypothetical protein